MQKITSREWILNRLEKAGYVTVADLAAELGCSDMTIRRHLARLEAERLVERSRGGATVTRRVRIEFALYERASIRMTEKAAIGRAAAALLREGDRILIDTGTTALAMVRALHGRGGLTVITTNLAVVSELLHSPGIECMLLGGIVRESSPDLYGPLLEETLARLHAERAFIGCDSLSTEGELMTIDPRTARATALMIKNSAEVTLLADSSKAGRNSFITFGRLADVDRLITDEHMDPAILDLAQRLGVETVVVNARSEAGCEDAALQPEGLRRENHGT